MSDIYQRIADVHYDHGLEEHGSFYRCSCGQQFTYKVDHDGHFADVLVEELGLSIERNWVPQETNRAPALPVRGHRYVTPWTQDD